MDNTPSHLNLPKRIHWNELTGKMMRALHDFNHEPVNWLDSIVKLNDNDLSEEEFRRKYPLLMITKPK